MALALCHDVSAMPSLVEAIQQADAKYLEVPDLMTRDSAPKIEAGGGEEETAPTAKEIAQGAIKATLTYREGKGEGGEVMRVPIVTVTASGKEVAKLEGEEGLADPPVGVEIAELDPVNTSPEVVVSFFTGGAHCCSQTTVLTSSKDGSTWRTVELGEFDGGPLLASDLDGDGRYEFETRDNAFLYSFGCYACSSAPLEVLAVEDGVVKNVTADPRFRAAHEVWLKDMIADVPDQDVNGFLAGYVAEKILLGESKQAWQLMLTYYDRSSDWGLDICDQPPDERGDCLGKQLHLSFPDALERMLKENGYNVEK